LNVIVVSFAVSNFICVYKNSDGKVVSIEKDADPYQGFKSSVCSTPGFCYRFLLTAGWLLLISGIFSHIKNWVACHGKDCRCNFMGFSNLLPSGSGLSRKLSCRTSLSMAQKEKETWHFVKSEGMGCLYGIRIGFKLFASFFMN
jgi:hypothetical protein